MKQRALFVEPWQAQRRARIPFRLFCENAEKGVKGREAARGCKRPEREVRVRVSLAKTQTSDTRATKLEQQQHLANELHVLRRLHVLPKVDGLEVEADASGTLVDVEHRLAAREGSVRRPRAGDLPRKQARREGHDGVQLVVLRWPHREGHEGGVLGSDVVLVREARHQVFADVLGESFRMSVGCLVSNIRKLEAVFRVARKPAGVAPRNVGVAGNVPHHENVLRLGDHGLEVAGVVTGKCVV